MIVFLMAVGLGWYLFIKQEPVTEDLLLPDLRLSPPGQLYITINNGTKKIRFTTSFINFGKGPLEISGRSDPQNQKTRASQKIFKADGTTLEREIGEFAFHPGHEHWHVENYTLFELWSLEENNERGRLVAATNKMSFCLWDEEVYDLTLENASQVQKYAGCNNETQGISVGWSDSYEADIEGQELDISSVQDGSYIVRSVINPDRKIWETDYNNNEAVLYIRISGNSLTIKSPNQE